MRLRFASRCSNRHVHLVVEHEAENRFLVRDLHADADVGKALLEGPQEARHEKVGRRDGRNPESAAREPLEPVEHVVHFLDLLQDGPCVAVDLLAGLGQVNTLAELLGQRQASLLLELPNLHRHGGLGQVQLFGRFREAQVLGYCRKTLQLPERQVHK
jgi:hypothetical protein